MRNLDDKEIVILKEGLKLKNRQKLRTVIYARKSTEDKKVTSIPTQIAQCKQFISNYEFLELVDVFQEDNVSGMFTDGRSEFLKMMNLAEKKEIDAIVVMKLDRLARDMALATTTIKLLQSYQCFLLAGDDVADSSTPVGEFMRNVLMAQNQYHARRVASDVMSSECNNARKGDSAGGKAPYGLKTINKRFYVNEDEAPAVKIMFEYTAQGKSYKQIVDKLNMLGYITRAGKSFTYSTINTILKNEKYYGTYVYNKIGSKRKKNRVLTEHFDEVRTEQAIEPIISKSLFDKVQEALEKRKNICNPKQDSSSYVLTGLIYCAHCGHAMTGTTQVGGRTKKRYRTHVCPNHIKRSGNNCPTKPINADYIEKYVKNLLTNVINEHLACNQATPIFSGLAQRVSEEIAGLIKQIDSIEKRITALLDKAANPDTSSSLVDRYEAQADKLVSAQNQLKANLDKLSLKKQNLESINNCFINRTKVLTADEIFISKEITRQLFRIFINKIVVSDSTDDIEIIFNH